MKLKPPPPQQAATQQKATSHPTTRCHTTTASPTTSNKLPNLKTYLGDGEVTEMLRRKSLKEKRLRMQINVSVPQNTFGSSLLTPYLPITRFSAITAEMYWCRKSARNLQIYISPRFLTAIDSQAFDIHVLFSLQVSARGGCWCPSVLPLLLTQKKGKSCWKKK